MGKIAQHSLQLSYLEMYHETFHATFNKYIPCIHVVSVQGVSQIVA